jgi:hypothetical protein
MQNLPRQFPSACPWRLEFLRAGTEVNEKDEAEDEQYGGVKSKSNGKTPYL